MHVLIDGYNLLNAANIPSHGYGIGHLERSRLGLLHFLVESLDPAELAQTVVVFDAREPPPGLPRAIQFHGLSVRFAVKYESADALIEELIRADFTPKQLTVVSSDHRIQRAARRRKARAVDSEAWYAEVMRRQSQQGRPRQPAARPATPLLAGEVARWLEQFGGEAIVEQVIQEERSKGSAPVRPANPVPPARPAAPPSRQTLPGRKKAAHPGSAKKRRNPANPFPLGYGEDLLKKNQASDLRNPFPPGYAEDLEGEN
jgi:predicted RNA-binding protein with PIN domain